MVAAAKVICDSISPQGIRLTTMQVTMHRFVLAEFNTHRMFSRNFRSSRAVPVKKLLEEVRTNPAMPVYWGVNQAGMQAQEELDDTNHNIVSNGDQLITLRELAKNQWRAAADMAAERAEIMASIGVHKQIVNRVLEPFLYVHGVVTATEWDNFFGLRLHRDAQPEMRALAVAMWEARSASKPMNLQPGNWHLPFMDEDWHGGEALDYSDSLREQIAIKCSVARCARVSYLSFETGKRSTVEEDLKLYDRLMGAQPLHASPAEHQATPDIYHGLIKSGSPELMDSDLWENKEEWGNLRGWRQYRKLLEGEAVAPLPKEYIG